MNTNAEPKLAKPGSGLPIPHRWVARLLVPYQAKKSDWNENIERFNRHSKAIDDYSKSMTTEQLNTRFLVEPILGLEDSSRYWSPAMILDHLLITGPHFRQIISELSNAKIPTLEIRVDKVKPPVRHHELEVVQQFSRFWSEFIPTLKLGTDRFATCIKHPWFGRLNAHQWLYVLSLHHGVHLQQMKQVVESFAAT